MAVHHHVIPDCPYCGKELTRVEGFEAGTEGDPKGERVYWYSCTCGWESVRVGEEEFEELTYLLILEG